MAGNHRSVSTAFADHAIGRLCPAMRLGVYPRWEAAPLRAATRRRTDARRRAARSAAGPSGTACPRSSSQHRDAWLELSGNGEARALGGGPQTHRGRGARLGPGSREEHDGPAAERGGCPATSETAAETSARRPLSSEFLGSEAPRRRLDAPT